jgi:hypothetical protein
MDADNRSPLVRVKEGLLALAGVDEVKIEALVFVRTPEAFDERFVVVHEESFPGVAVSNELRKEFFGVQEIGDEIRHGGLRSRMCF